LDNWVASHRYYLNHKVQVIGFHPEIIIAGRRVNDGMGSYVASELVKAMIKAGHTVSNARVLVMGLTFKENCPDLRNTRVIDVVEELREFGCKVDVTDCWADNAEAEHEYRISLVDEPASGAYDAVILAVPHKEYAAMAASDLRGYLNERGVLYDLKGVLHLGEADLRL
jgi:UDP-N-acetyl-D-galactosamine dehydrogenase